MPNFQWRGDGLKALVRVLAPRGWQPGPRGLLVVRTPRAEVPVVRGGAWIWVCGETPAPAALQAAVDSGAVDVIPQQVGWEQRLLLRLQESLVEAPPLPPAKDFIAQSAAAKRLLRDLHQASQSAMPVLLMGETGTGKEVASRLIHQWSSRRHKAFVPINCAAIPDELMEGELFGYVRGAFSGATRDYDGQLLAAEHGTVFLDEIDDTPLVLQNKLLRVLEDRVISRLGENVWKKVDFRVVAASNRDLGAMIQRGEFGADLFERLATVQVSLPPLRERLDDLPALVEQLCARFYAEDPAAARRAHVQAATPEALALLRAYSWPGNVRELRNVVFGALVGKRTGDTLLVSDLPRRLWARGESGGEDLGLEARLAQGSFNLRREVEALERQALQAALRRANGNAAEAARLLGEVGRGSAKDPGGTVRVMMKRLGLDRTDARATLGDHPIP